MSPLARALRLASLAVLALAFWWLSRGGGGAASTSYYPLTTGLSWDYEVSSSASQADPVRLRVINAGRRRIDSWNTEAQRLDVGTSVGYRFAVEAADSISIVAEQAPGKNEPAVLDPPALLLRLPAEVGQTWNSEATTSAIRPGTRIPVTTTIDSASDRVDGPAGRFDGCLRVTSSGKMAVEIAEGEASEVRIQTQIWYARGVGVVQVERRESSERAEPTEIVVRYRLVARGS